MSDDGGHQLPNVIYPGILDRAEMVDWVERFYGEYYFRPKAAWRIVARPCSTATIASACIKKPRAIMSLRHKRKKYVADYKAEGSIRRIKSRRTSEAVRETRVGLKLVNADGPTRLRWKTRLFLTLVYRQSTARKSLLTLGMKHRGLDSPWDYLAAIFTPYVALGIALLIVWLLSRMALLSWADLSYVLPLTAARLHHHAAIGRFVLNEQISLLAGPARC